MSEYKMGMKSKYLQLFKYLIEFSKLRSKAVRDIEVSVPDSQYPERVWLADIPQCEIFDCVTFQNYNQDADYWLKISKPKEPQHPTFPKLSETLSDWIIKHSLTVEIGTPVLNQNIIKNDETIQLSDQPEIILEFEDYIKNQWPDDLEFYNKELEIYQPKLAQFKKQSETYKQFFTIYNKVQQFGQEFELIFGAGLLYFREDANTPLICRHILTIKAEITFASPQVQLLIKVSPSIEHVIQIETDAILDLVGQFDAENINAAETEVAKFLKEQQISDDLFADQIKEALNIFVDRIREDGDGKSIDELSKPKDIPQKPTIYLAPALLLRKRDTKSLTALYKKIVEDVEKADEAIEIPSLNEIIGFPQALSPALNDGIIYFPKKYNDEQIQIIEKMRRNNKILVQGPPGTGKSHTIANLICHLLANGKKVLVTAYTKRALEVLKQQLPEDFQNLTVNLLSGDSASIQDLNNSVNAINDKLANTTNIAAFRREIEQLASSLSEIKEARAYTKNEWLKVKEQSTRTQTINPNYQGTLSEIAEKLEKDSANFCWFIDNCSNPEQIKLILELEEFNLLAQHYRLIDCAAFDYAIPKSERLLSVAELLEYQGIENKLLQNHPSPENYNSIVCSDFQALEQYLGKLQTLCLVIEACPLPFKSGIINGYPANQSLWTDKISKTNQLLIGLDQVYLRQFERDVTIKYPESKTWAELKNDATILLAHLNKGNRLNGLAFKLLKKPVLPIHIKRVLYFIDDVKVLGQPCDTISAFETVLTDIKIKQDLEELEYIWNTRPTKNSIPYFEKAGYYQKIKEFVESLINTTGEISETKAAIATISSVSIDHYETNKVKQLLNEADYHHLLIQKTAYNEKIAEIRHYLSSQDIHPIAESIVAAIEGFDTHQYQEYLSALGELDSEKEIYNQYKKLEENLQQYFPILINNILQDTFDVSHLSSLENAIYFKHAFAEITKQLEKDYEASLIEKLADLEQQEEKLVSELGSQKAWLSVLERLIENPFLRQNLKAWVQAVSKIGKTGIGKKALKFQREAQQQMEKCKDSIPCWVMPLYKVAETIKPEQGMYDYVIIDEASQLGADALFLLYISKNIIIVGDDKQTSPEYIGVSPNVMTPHINRLLQNIPFANFFGTDFSFFDHADRFCDGRIVLREHFRCMPEIIEFCNKWFYATNNIGLYPLKQYSENRLDPLRTIYCQSGYVDGTSSNIINEIEAQGIADKIAELIQNETYNSKSFGVIALQGNRQAAKIEKLILEKIGEVEYNNRNIVCGNSASFQGDERDVMFLSLITAHNHNRRALTDPEDERRFNVAVSRAKEQIWLFHSVELQDLSNTDDLRYKLLNHFLNYNEQQTPIHSLVPRGLGNQPAPFDSWFEVDVFNDIVIKNYPVIPQYKVANGRYRIDLVILLPNGIKIAVECDGDKYHGAEQFENDMMRQKVLERCGWQFFRVRGAEYYSNRIKALEPLWELLRKNEAQKQIPPITIPEQANKKEKTESDTVETKQSEDKKPPVPVTDNPSKQIDLFSQGADAESEQQAPVVGRTNRPSKLSAFSEFLVFTSMQNVYRVENKAFTSEAQVKRHVELEAGEKPLFQPIGVNNYGGYLILAFKNGKVAKISFTRYQSRRKKLENAFSGESELIYIEHIDNDVDLVAISNKNKIILFNTENIRKVGNKASIGVQVMQLQDENIMTAVKKLDEVKLNDSEYYRKANLNVVGYYLKKGDEV
ncbi:MAG: AAA domain-containing protein [Methylococcaceae bacterium]